MSIAEMKLEAINQITKLTRQIIEWLTINAEAM